MLKITRYDYFLEFPRFSRDVYGIYFIEDHQFSDLEKAWLVNGVEKEPNHTKYFMDLKNDDKVYKCLQKEELFVVEKVQTTSNDVILSKMRMK